MTGAPTRIIAKGEYKGRHKFNGPKKIVVVTSDEERAAERDYELETGHCAECLGSGKVLARWSRDEGRLYRPCRECGGTGKCQP